MQNMVAADTMTFMPTRRKPGRPTLRPGVRLSRNIIFRVSVSEGRAIERAARLAGKSPSDFLRSVALKAAARRIGKERPK